MKIIKKFLNDFKLNLNKKNKLIIIINYNKFIYSLCLLLYNKNYIINIFWFIKLKKLYLLLILNYKKNIKKILYVKKKFFKKNYNTFLNIYITNFGLYSYNIIKLFKINGYLFCVIL